MCVVGVPTVGGVLRRVAGRKKKGWWEDVGRGKTGGWERGMNVCDDVGNKNRIAMI